MNGISEVRRLVVPTPTPLTPVNVYALKGELGYYLIDGGIATEEAKKLIKEWAPLPLAGILVTHSHGDHTGVIIELAREHGCPIYISAGELSRLKDLEGPKKDYDQVLFEGGVPATERHQAIEAVKVARGIDEHAAKTIEIIEILPGQKFATDLGNLEVIPTPGHSAGHCCFYLADRQLLFSGDHILANISPNPVLDLGTNRKRRKSFVEYMNSLRTILSLPIQWVFPGHGDPFQNLDEIIENFRAFYTHREQVILRTLSDRPQTPFQISKKIYPAMEGLDILLGISKVWGQLDLLELEGRVLGTEENGVNYYVILK